MSDWAVPQQSRLKYSQVFNTNDRQRTGVLTGIQARNILIQSGLTENILAQIWFLSDIDRDGMLTCEEFILAMHLIEMVKQGITLPITLPPNLIPPTIKRKMSLISPTLSEKGKEQKFNANNTSLNRISSGNKQSTSELSQSPNSNCSEFNIPQQSKLKYTQLFNSVDQNRTGFLTGLQARNILMNSGLSQKILASVWNLSDVDKDGKLTCEEFVLSMHLIDLVKSGETLPLTLPPDLISLNFRKGSINGITPILSSTNQQSLNSNDTNCNTFEDKRKENFEKGQAELEKRRQLLLEQQKREQEERERKEKEELKKKERIRLEQERKKKEELERQLQTQRELEMQKDEERRKQQELKEAARREMEKQRMIEWENQKKSEMILSKQRFQDLLINLKAKKQKLGLEVEKINSQLNNLKDKVEETRKKVSDSKSEIDKMRINRDAKLQEINFLKNENIKFQEQHLFIEQEKKNLTLKLKNLSSLQNQNVSESTEFAIKSKQIRIDQLKEQLIESEKEKENKLKDLEKNNEEINLYKKKYEEIIINTLELQKIYDEKRKEALDLIEKSIKQAEEASKLVDFNVIWGNDGEPVKNADNLSIDTTSDIKYKAIYDFKATNLDDLDLKVNDIITYVPSAKTQYGWLQGKLNDKIGWFPESYVKLINDSKDLNVSETTSDLKFISSEDNNSNNSTINDSYAYVLYDWDATNDSHLSIKANDKVKILDTSSDWLLGELNGKTGWIPKSYVNPNQNCEYYISFFEYRSNEPDDLTFGINELIHVTKKDGEWWSGEISDGRKGIFPCTFVREAKNDELDFFNFKKNISETQNQEKIDNLLNQSTESTPVRSSETNKSKKSKLKKPEIVTVIANYKAGTKHQLDLQKGQLIQVRKKLDSGWWEGETQIKGKKRQIGWFPSAYVKQLKTFTNTTDNSVGEFSNQKERVISLYPFKATQNDELSFQANEIIKVLDKKDSTWWKGESEKTGYVGLFPSNYVKIYNKCE